MNPERDHQDDDRFGTSRPRRRGISQGRNGRLFRMRRRSRTTWALKRYDSSRTFKDRYLIDYYPHQMLEGIANRVGSPRSRRRVHLHPRRNTPQAKVSSGAQGSLRAQDFGRRGLRSRFQTECYVHAGPARNCGEETGLLEALECNARCRETKTPFPRSRGLVRAADGIITSKRSAPVPHLHRKRPGVFLRRWNAVHLPARNFSAVRPRNTAGTKTNWESRSRSSINKLAVCMKG